MDTDNPTSDAGVDVSLLLYAKRPVAGERTVTIDRLSALNVDDAIDSFEVRTVSEEVMISQEGEADPRLEDLVTLAEWRGPDTRPAFDIEEAWTRTGRTVRKCTPPDTTLAVYASEDLTCVFPCTDGNRTWSVADFLDSYECDREPPTGIDVDLGTN